MFRDRNQTHQDQSSAWICESCKIPAFCFFRVICEVNIPIENLGIQTSKTWGCFTTAWIYLQINVCGTYPLDCTTSKKNLKSSNLISASFYPSVKKKNSYSYFLPILPGLVQDLNEPHIFFFFLRFCRSCLQYIKVFKLCSPLYKFKVLVSTPWMFY